MLDATAVRVNHLDNQASWVRTVGRRVTVSVSYKGISDDRVSGRGSRAASGTGVVNKAGCRPGSEANIRHTDNGREAGIGIISEFGLVSIRVGDL